MYIYIYIYIYTHIGAEAPRDPFWRCQTPEPRQCAGRRPGTPARRATPGLVRPQSGRGPRLAGDTAAIHALRAGPNRP